MNQIQKPQNKSIQNKSTVGETTVDPVELNDEIVAPSEVKAEPKGLSKTQKKAKGMKLTPIEVVATDVGFYGNRRIKPGDKFKLDDESDFSHNWMNRI